jgi:glycosidase
MKNKTTQSNIHYPSLYQINTRVWLRSLSKRYGHHVTLAQVPDEELDRLAFLGFEWIWLLGVWRTGDLGRQIASELPELRRVYQEALPDYQETDICSSPFAITAYSVSPDLGGDHGLAIFREQLGERDLKLLLDFIPNHTARDHPWLTLHPDYYVSRDEDLLISQPFNYARSTQSDKIFAFGRDPNFQGWSDTFQLNYGNQQLQSAMQEELMKVATTCDGVRCDMAMLILPEVFNQTWGIEIQPFWPEAISQIHEEYPDFTFIAEVYWELDWTLQQQGFNFTYDKRLYDRLIGQEARSVREHLLADLDFQNHSVRFLENHDEIRAANTFPPHVHRAAAIIAYLTPGLRFFHQGQLQGFQTHIPMQLCRGPQEYQDPEIALFYSRLFEILQIPLLQDGNWLLLECLPAWQSNWTWDNFVAFSWHAEEYGRLLVVVNYSTHQSQCYVRLPWKDMVGKQIDFKDKMSDAEFNREGNDMQQTGLYLDMPGWGIHVFEVRMV